MLELYRRLFSAVVLHSALTVITVLALAKHLIAIYWINRYTHEDSRDTRPASYAKIVEQNVSNTPINIDDKTTNVKENSDFIHFDHMTNNPFDNLILAEDLNLVPQLKYYYNQYNIDIEEFKVTTKDGYIIDLWHLKNRDHKFGSSGASSAQTSVDREPILMLHGLLQSSGSFASSGRKSLAFHLNENGYDVWLGNNRCGFNPAANTKIDDFWDWDMTEMVKYDLSALIDFVLQQSGSKKLHLVAHSQGTTQGFMALINHNHEYPFSSKISKFVALAPAVYPGPLLDEKIFVRLMAKYIDNPWVFGRKSFLKTMMIARNLMIGQKFFSFICYIFFNYLFEWNDSLWDKSLRDRHFLFSPVHISVKLMQWWLSPDPNKVSFKNCSHQLFPDNKSWFNKEIDFDENRTNIMMVFPRQDRLVDGERLINHFVYHENHSIFKIWYIDEYSHLDVLWAHDVIERVGKPMLKFLQE
ncbi:hypothetical protein RNJ44_02926 [Nakaseomyces bracarensis]|uniref:Partial AB-hydrolase lipase domain-containing protein n=1 Tax=Nakaseomyces bracarensis TaxID=273131 RepID=A0ABR4P0M0_9SACH